jgi:hypothetical protein
MSATVHRIETGPVLDPDSWEESGDDKAADLAAGGEPVADNLPKESAKPTGPHFVAAAD